MFMLKRLSLFVITLSFFLSAQQVFADEKKSYTTQHTNHAPRIDGKLDDECWKEISPATDFITHDPQFGKQPTYKTEVRVLYDNNAIYIGAKMYDPEPKKIGNSLVLRDEGMDQDYFLVGFDTYHDGVNAYRFRVTASNVQADERLKSDNLDQTWDAVWNSKTKIDDDGWSIEIEIPFSAIRFPNKPLQ